MWMRVFTLLSLGLLLCSPLISGESRSTRELTFMFITSFGKYGFNSSGVIPAAEMALRDINNSSDVLPGYTLRYDKVRDSQCHHTHSLDAFFEGIHSEPVKIAVIGCGCSVATVPVAEISHRWNITQISYASATSTLSNRERFRRYFRTSLTIENVAPALHATLEHFKWTRIALLTQNENLFTGAESAIRSELEASGITVASSLFHSSDANPVASVKDFFFQSEDYRIFLLNCYSLTARQIVCEASKQGLTYPRYAWITFDWYPQRWWTTEVSKNTMDCTDSELADFIEKMITIRRQTEPDSPDIITDAGITTTDFLEEYETRAVEEEYSIVGSAVRIYDVLWIFALALKNTMTMINTRDISGTGCENIAGELVPLEKFNYTNEKIGCIIQYHLQRTNYSGGSGQVVFDENGTRINHQVKLKQYRFDENRSLEKINFAFIDRTDNYTFTFEPSFDDSYVYPDGVPPDGKKDEDIRTYETALVVFIYVLATIGIGFAIICLTFNFVFRTKRIVKLSSPSLNYFIVIGAILMYTAMYIHLIPSTSKEVFEAHCVLKDWLFIIGYALCYGTVLAKMYRIYYIFQNPTAKKTALHDWHLMLITVAVSSVAVLLLLLQSSIPNLRGEVQLEGDSEHPDGETDLGVQIEYYVWVCYDTPSTAAYWQIFIFAYLAVLQIVGIVLAFQTRRVKYKALRDSTFIGAIIYISSLVLVFLGVSTFALRTYINARGAMFACGIFILTTIFLALIFIPRMLLLYKDPEGKTAFEESNAKSITLGTVDMQSDPTKVTLQERQLHQTIEKLTAELSKLKALQVQGEEKTS